MSPDLVTITTVALLYAAIVVSPGPNFALISRLAISGASRTASGATLGLATAATLYAVLSMTGLSLVLLQIGWLAGAVQIAGGLFLVYLGVSSWLRSKPSGPGAVVPSPHDTFARGLRLGLLVNLSNPKAIMFFVGLYAVAIPADTGVGAKIAILMVGFALEILWYGLVIVMLSTGPARAAYNRFGIWIERALGTLLIVFGIRLAFQRQT